ncbi:MAG: hypothetical protein LBI49_25145 [Nocardiopsaceae bacterium]|jgi:tRNA A37 threonylcarbamoyladenosine synthetase subunit TsaC/SUA5/YrdC|nr:hypothetical protein [Nocardiopsaceae bacterium]
MTIVPGDAAGLRRAAGVLDAGVPVVMPLPSPLPYGLAGTNAANVNAAKGRPAGQTTGMLVADIALVVPYAELGAHSWAFVRWLATEQMMNLLLPIREGSPAWAKPSTSQGWLGVTAACLAEMRVLLDQRGLLYVSSANRTGGQVAVTAPTANAAFADQLLVIDGDPFRDPAAFSGSATMLRVERRGGLSLVRHGIHDAGFAGGTDQFLQHLTRLWRASTRS